MLAFVNKITKLGAITKFADLVNGSWIFPLWNAELAVNSAGNEFGGHFEFKNGYRGLALAEDSELEVIADLDLPPLTWWHPANPGVPGRLIVAELSKEVLQSVSKFF